MPWFKVDDKLHGHVKVAEAGEAMALWVVAGSWSSDHLTDGFIPASMVGRLMPGGVDMAARLVEVGLWVEDSRDGRDGFRFHEWAERNPTSEDVEEKRAAARERMRKVRSNKKDTPGSEDVRANSDERSDEQDAKFADGSPYPVPDPVPEPTPVSSERVPIASDSKSDNEWATDDTDVDEVKATARTVAKMIADNGHSLPPKNSKNAETWLIHMDRLLRLGPPGQTTVDPPTADEVIEVARWATSDSFWAPNIASIPKLREKWSQLALKARDGPSRNGQPTGLEAVVAASRRAG